MNGLTRAQNALFSGTGREEGSDGKRLLGGGVRFERIRRITGYLVGTLDRFNDAKRAEERERVKHQGDNDATK